MSILLTIRSQSFVSYGRHSKSINTEVSGCGQCRSRLTLVNSPRLKKDGTPHKENRYQIFVKVSGCDVMRVIVCDVFRT